jgi:hypothetical protein
MAGLPDLPQGSQRQEYVARCSSRSLRLVLGKMPQLVLQRLDLSFRIHQLMFLLPKQLAIHL